MNLLDKAKSLVPVLSYDMHKGDCGRLGFFGGCEEYTGAPYFAAISALKLGADLSHIYCEKDAAPIIKSYSPDLIVHPYLRSLENTSGLPENHIDFIHQKIIGTTSKQHAFSIGSGLGRDPNIHKSIALMISHAKNANVPIVLDADSIYIVAQNPQLVSGHKLAILTPNVNEFKTLATALGIDSKPIVENVEKVAKELNGVTIVLKGKQDIITNGISTIYCNQTGGLKRCGGQGDVLSGAIATFLGWGICKSQKRWIENRSEQEISSEELPLLAAYSGCKVTRTASHLTFEKH
ncbi:hypothetical protein BB559_006520 [Furculomyces boomerangus]|uniref:ATP-dependent (S)-NAD(P)H-hydrate dehydratase n=2 Tax=Furculomyces boomerangus TaxID=61424 RepID=A0A2T9Y286_9FUNG|nr:hypothetical protein BB559_006520 [Furculomyces boomerangus]